MVVLRDENVAEGGRDENARQKVGGLEHCETIAVGKRVRVERGQEVNFRELCLSPFVECGGNRRG
jgi:hypothetical protein